MGAWTAPSGAGRCRAETSSSTGSWLPVVGQPTSRRRDSTSMSKPPSSSPTREAGGGGPRGLDPHSEATTWRRWPPGWETTRKSSAGRRYEMPAGGPPRGRGGTGVPGGPPGRRCGRACRPQRTGSGSTHPTGGRSEKSPP